MFRLCEWGQACTCWFDGIKSLGIDWKEACENHDNRHKNMPDKFLPWILNKLEADGDLALIVLKSGKWRYTLIIAFVMYVGVSTFGWVWYIKDTLRIKL